ncbi:type II toxin-antitoxin system VapC family toxin (plasmid) [Sphingobium fuliginis]|jgi:predicted nucleic acid-binding protein|uniref:Ribonuclease VapC n=1 Tax=Sphingobium fuliginis (strain ATCC 27551) TaxID=336203 RepID=A0A7M2GQU3_SPHSA|nr:MULTISPECIES: type II toxin-antitoxin system VapC family toxin [Sphingobium]QOT74527.1 type II toxin-antitoxin system VapC family toxin [Sphingobium fuliginis]
MIVVDTNVISEMAKPQPSISVRRWLDAQPFDALYLTTITMAEMRFGIMVLPASKRRSFLEAALERTEQLYAGRILSFDQDAARHYADLATLARAKGKGFPAPDAYIAAIAAANGFIVSTRDTAPFEAAGLGVINPWLSTN